MNRYDWVYAFKEELMSKTDPPVAGRVAYALGMSLYDPKLDPEQAARDWATLREGRRADPVRATSKPAAEPKRRSR